MDEKGICKEHGEFILAEGCPQCLAEKQAGPGGPGANTYGAKSEPAAETAIVKVQYYSETTGELSPREYTYYSADRLTVGDIVIVPVRDRTGKAKVSAVDVPEAEIASFKDKVKIIPAGSVVRAQVEIKVTSPGVTPEPLSEEARAILTGGRDEMIKDATSPATEAAVALRPGEDIEARSYYEEALRALDYAEKRVITTIDHVKAATDDLALISKLKKVMENKRRSLLDPLKLQAEAIRETYSSLMDPIIKADRITREKMLAFSREQERIRWEQEEINRKRQEAAEAEMRLKGELSEPVGLVEVAPEPAKSVSTDMGSTGMTDHWKYEVVDFALLPDEYKVVDGALLTAVARKHHDQKQIPGVRFYNEPYIAVRTR